MQQDIILNRLLNKFENSQHSRELGSSNKSVRLRIQYKELPEYNYEDAATRDGFNKAAKALESMGLVVISWGVGDSVMGSISLVLEQAAVEKTYMLTNRVHPLKIARQLLRMLEETLPSPRTQWIEQWRDFIVSEIEKRGMSAFFARNMSFANDFIKMLAQYDSLRGASTTIRAFSISCFNDSKRFENEFASKLISAAGKFNTDLGDAKNRGEVGARELLALLGIYSQPEVYHISGKCKIVMKNGVCDLCPMSPYGIALSEHSLANIQSISLAGIDRILFIENLTNYNEYLRNEISETELVIYHGGFFSPRKKQLLELLAKSVTSGELHTDLKQIEINFWGDIDFGGFQMFYRLQSIFPTLQPLRMASIDIDRFAEQGLKRDEKYLARLRLAHENNDFPAFSEAIERILFYGVTIEQEAFLR